MVPLTLPPLLILVECHAICAIRMAYSGETDRIRTAWQLSLIMSETEYTDYNNDSDEEELIHEYSTAEEDGSALFTTFTTPRHRRQQHDHSNWR